MKLLEYQTYYIATDANHVTQHRRVVTPWFYVRLKPVKYIKFRFNELDEYAFWAKFVNNKFIFVRHIIGDGCKLRQKLDTVTMVFNYQDKQNEAN